MSSQAITISGRPCKTKRELKIALATIPHQVSLQAHFSVGGPMPEGTFPSLPDGTYSFVLPDIYTRKTFGDVIKRGDTYRVV